MHAAEASGEGKGSCDDEGNLAQCSFVTCDTLLFLPSPTPPPSHAQRTTQVGPLTGLPEASSAFRCSCSRRSQTSCRLVSAGPAQTGHLCQAFEHAALARQRGGSGGAPDRPKLQPLQLVAAVGDVGAHQVKLRIFYRNGPSFLIRLVCGNDVR